PTRRALGAALLLALALPSVARAQELPFETFAQFTDSLTAVATIPDPDEREAAVDALWDALVAAERVPFALGDSAAFLWRGPASTVQVAGDHTSWNPSGHGLQPVGLSDVWLRTYRFPAAARIDYKLVVNGTWILDPNNPHQQWSGFGPNSELRMPEWVFPEETVRDPNVPQGAFSGPLTIESDHLPYPVGYRVYTPPGYDAEQLADLPTVYVTDGHEYADDRLGAFRIVLDNLIADGRAAPAVVVFVDPRAVGDPGNNRRFEQYVQNPDFAAFVAEELVAHVDATYRTRPERDARTILGTSLGGLFSAYLGVLHPDVFGHLAIQSPAFWVSENPQYWDGPSIYEMVAGAEDGAFDVYMSTGTINDTQAGAQQMRTVFEAHGHDLTYREVPEGHSWGNWRALLDEVLIALVPGPAATDAEAAPPADATGLRLAPAPNPARGGTTLRFRLAAPARVGLACYDLRGRAVLQPLDAAPLPAGPHAVALAAADFGAAGTYACRLTAGDAAATALVTLLR
ncbi:MAG: alpha/beta hydrolase-fold protein, partial [Rhodothermales bacterium]|nr:alpha/beta hydrolase-fold protein [Rhodothermales bacterium]